ncbi:hypothetical protein ACQ4PT_013373 [Festuca glaucescens]
MEVKVLSSKLVKPAYNGGAAPATEYIPLSIFDKVTYQMQMAIIYAFAAPAPSTAAIEKGLAAVLNQYRAFAGQIGVNPDDGVPSFILNDRGVRVVEASVDADMVDMAPAKPTPELLKLHPDIEGELEEVVLLQLTRFRCGSLAIGFTSNHVAADGHATSNFLVAWGRATRGLPMGPPPVHHHRDLFKPRSSPRVEHDHRNREYYKPSPTAVVGHNGNGADNIVIHKAHFTKDFIAGMRANASEGRGRPFSRFEIILAHLWRTMTRARGLSPEETSTIRLSVDGRHRLGKPAEYFGNMVLWAFPRATVGDLLNRPLKHAAQVIHDEVVRVDGAYFQSFVDFATSGAAKEGLSRSALCKDVLCPDVEVDSWLTFPFYELDFGTGSPSYFMPSYFPTEGMLFLAPSYIGDGSVDAFVPVFEHNLQAFKECCYSVE